LRCGKKNAEFFKLLQHINNNLNVLQHLNLLIKSIGGFNNGEQRAHTTKKARKGVGKVWKTSGLSRALPKFVPIADFERRAA
jgi:hypothetical protein